jgi:hypothetical protein
MKLTSISREILRYRREVRKLEKAGYERVELYRNWIQGPEIISAVIIGPDRQSIWWKKEMPPIANQRELG